VVKNKTAKPVFWAVHDSRFENHWVTRVSDSTNLGLHSPAPCA